MFKIDPNIVPPDDVHRAFKILCGRSVPDGIRLRVTKSFDGAKGSVTVYFPHGSDVAFDIEVYAAGRYADREGTRMCKCGHTAFKHEPTADHERGPCGMANCECEVLISNQ